MPPFTGFGGKPSDNPGINKNPEKYTPDIDGPQPGSNDDNSIKSASGQHGGIGGGGFGSSGRDGGRKADRSSGSGRARRERGNDR